MSKKTKDTEYLTISAMLRAREASMLSREKMDRMLAAASYAEAAKLWPSAAMRTSPSRTPPG